MTHDLSLHSGERQTAQRYDEIRADHRFRYEWADARIAAGTFGIDAFCGNGYGAWLLGERRGIWGIDGSPDAIAAANAHFRRPATFFSIGYYPFELPASSFDFVVSLESIEHVAEGGELFARLANALKPGGTMIYSTPSEEHLPHSATGNNFHFRHYTLAETLALGNSHGLEVQEFAGQDTYSFTPEGRQGPLLATEAMALKSGQPGQFIIVHARKR